MTEYAKANRNEACSFMLITERLDKFDRMMDYARCIAKDFPDPDPKKMTADGHAHMLEVRQTQLRQTLTHASSLLSRIVTEYERLVRVKFVGCFEGQSDIFIYVCGECTDCRGDEIGVLNPYGCALRKEESYKKIQYHIKIAIENLSVMLNWAQELGCDEPELSYGSVRKIIMKWGKEGYHHYLKDETVQETLAEKTYDGA